MQIATNYMVLKMYCKDYQAAIKKEGVKCFPPVSSQILLYPTGGEGLRDFSDTRDWRRLLQMLSDIFSGEMSSAASLVLGGKMGKPAGNYMFF